MKDPALESFLRTIRIRALKYAQLRLNQEEIALDLLQEAMIDFVDAFDGYSAGAWSGLFYKILNRRMADWQRKQYRRQRLLQIVSFGQLGSDEESEEPTVVDHNCAAEEYQAEILQQQFQQALQKLPDRQQQAYLLRQWNGLSVRETAEVMECSEGSVKTHLSRALRQLRTALGEWTDEEN